MHYEHISFRNVFCIFINVIFPYTDATRVSLVAVNFLKEPTIIYRGRGWIGWGDALF